MTFCSRVGVLAVVLLLASPVEAQVKFANFTSEHGRFTVLMPGTPKQNSEVTNDPTLSAPYTLYTFVATAGTLAFLVGYVDYPPDFRPTIDEELNANQVNFNKGVKAELIAAKRIDFRRGPGDLLPALEFASVSATHNFKSTVIWEGPRIYQIAARIPKGSDATREIERFFASFVLRRPN